MARPESSQDATPWNDQDDILLPNLLEDSSLESHSMTCHVCYSNYDAGIHRPWDLGCHTICQSCFYRLKDRGGQLLCPKCRSTWQNPHLAYDMLHVVLACKLLQLQHTSQQTVFGAGQDKLSWAAQCAKTLLDLLPASWRFLLVDSLPSTDSSLSAREHGFHFIMNFQPLASAMVWALPPLVLLILTQLWKWVYPALLLTTPLCLAVGLYVKELIRVLTRNAALRRLGFHPPPSSHVNTCMLFACIIAGMPSVASLVYLIRTGLWVECLHVTAGTMLLVFTGFQIWQHGVMKRPDAVRSMHAVLLAWTCMVFLVLSTHVLQFGNMTSAVSSALPTLSLEYTSNSTQPSSGVAQMLTDVAHALCPSSELGVMSSVPSLTSADPSSSAISEEGLFSAAMSSQSRASMGPEALHALCSRILAAVGSVRGMPEDGEASERGEIGSLSTLLSQVQALTGLPEGEAVPSPCSEGGGVLPCAPLTTLASSALLLKSGARGGSIWSQLLFLGWVSSPSLLLWAFTTVCRALQSVVGQRLSALHSGGVTGAPGDLRIQWGRLNDVIALRLALYSALTLMTKGYLGNSVALGIQAVFIFLTYEMPINNVLSASLKENTAYMDEPQGGTACLLLMLMSRSTIMTWCLAIPTLYNFLQSMDRVPYLPLTLFGKVAAGIWTMLMLVYGVMAWRRNVFRAARIRWRYLMRSWNATEQQRAVTEMRLVFVKVVFAAIPPLLLVLKALGAHSLVWWIGADISLASFCLEILLLLLHSLVKVIPTQRIIGLHGLKLSDCCFLLGIGGPRAFPPILSSWWEASVLAQILEPDRWKGPLSWALRCVGKNVTTVLKRIRGTLAPFLGLASYCPLFSKAARGTSQPAPPATATSASLVAGQAEPGADRRVFESESQLVAPNRRISHGAVAAAARRVLQARAVAMILASGARASRALALTEWVARGSVGLSTTTRAGQPVRGDGTIASLFEDQEGGSVRREDNFSTGGSSMLEKLYFQIALDALNPNSPTLNQVGVQLISRLKHAIMETEAMLSEDSDTEESELSSHREHPRATLMVSESTLLMAAQAVGRREILAETEPQLPGRRVEGGSSSPGTEESSLSLGPQQGEPHSSGAGGLQTETGGPSVGVVLQQAAAPRTSNTLLSPGASPSNLQGLGATGGSQQSASSSQGATPPSTTPGASDRSLLAQLPWLSGMREAVGSAAASSASTGGSATVVPPRRHVVSRSGQAPISADDAARFSSPGQP